MASFIDVGLLQAGSPIFVFLLVFFLVYAVLSSTKLFDLDKFPKGVIAFVVALLTLFSPAVTNTIIVAIPWFTFGVFFLTFLLIILFTVGVTKEDVSKTLSSASHGSSIKNSIIVFAFIVIIASAASQFSTFTGDEAGTAGEPNSGDSITTASGNIDQDAVGDKGADALLATLFNPKVLGFIAIMLIAVVTALFMGSNVK